MALDKRNLIELAKITAKADPSSQVAYSFGDEKFSYSDLNTTLRKELNELAGTYSAFRENKNLIFSLMEETFDDVLPRKVNEQYGQFAEIKQFKQGDKPVFTQKISTAAKRRAKQFITKVGLAGIYEVFKLDGKHFEIPTSAFGGAAQIGFEEFMDGRVNMADVSDIIMQGIDEALYVEIERALISSVSSLKSANFHTDTRFNEDAMDRLIAVSDSYGPTTIYCTYEFAATMVPSTGWISDDMKNDRWNNGYLGNYKGHRVIILNQSYDIDNDKKVIDPSYAWLIPGGSNDKPVKIAMEGQTIVRDIDNADMSKEIQVYKKFGVGTIITDNICVYQNTSLKRKNSDY